MRTVAGRLGHRNAATTLNVYAHFLEQTDRAAADIIGDIIAPRRMIWAFSDESERAATMLFVRDGMESSGGVAITGPRCLQVSV